MIYKRGRIYWYEFALNGVRVRESTKSTNRATAIKAEAKRRAQVLKKEPTFEGTFQEFSTEFLEWSKAQNTWNTYKRYRVSSKPLMRAFGELRLDELSTAHIEAFKMSRLKECSAAGVNRDLAALRFMLNFAVQMQYLEKNPFRVKMLKEDTGKMRTVSREEEELYMREAPPLLKDIATIILQTGMRPMEVFRIKGEHVNLDQRFIFIPEGKTKFARRTIPLTEKALEIFRRRWREGYLFPHRTKAGRHMTATVSHTTLQKRLKLDFRLYDFRHTFGSRSAMAGVDLPTLKELMGHSQISLTMRYVHPTPAHKIEAIRKLESYHNLPTVGKIEAVSAE